MLSHVPFSFIFGKGIKPHASGNIQSFFESKKRHKAGIVFPSLCRSSVIRFRVCGLAGYGIEAAPGHALHGVELPLLFLRELLVGYEFFHMLSPLLKCPSDIIAKAKPRCQITLFAEFDFDVFFLVLLDAVADENKNLAIGGTSLIVGNGVQLIQHLFINADRQALCGHNITPI